MALNESKKEKQAQTNVVYIRLMLAVVADMGFGMLIEPEQAIKVFGNRNCLIYFPRRPEFYRAEFCLVLKASRIFRALLCRLKPLSI